MKLKSDLAIVTCHFNWCGFNVPNRNLHRFIRQMDTGGIPLYGVELSLTGKFTTFGMKNWTHYVVNKNNVCFQQYACINLLEKLVPKEYTKIAWVDHDVMFQNTNWYDDASNKLEESKLIQLFDCYVATNIRGEELYSKCSCISKEAGNLSEIWTVDDMNGKSGVAWAAQRGLWEVGGLFPYSVMGGGDTVFLYAIFDNPHMQSKWRNFIDINGERFVNWKTNFRKFIGNDVSYISGKVFHEWHGDLECKSYRSRHDIVKGIDLNKNVRLNSSGIIEFNSVDDSFYNDVMKYFKDRDEDGEFILTKVKPTVL